MLSESHGNEGQVGDGEALEQRDLSKGLETALAQTPVEKGAKCGAIKGEERW